MSKPSCGDFKALTYRTNDTSRCNEMTSSFLLLSMAARRNRTRTRPAMNQHICSAGNQNTTFDGSNEKHIRRAVDPEA